MSGREESPQSLEGRFKMGLSIYGYGGVQLKELGGSPGEVNDLRFRDASHVCFSPPTDHPQADDLPAGIYSYLGSFEERLGSYSYYGEFCQKLAELVDAPFPGDAAQQARWKDVPFGALLYSSDTYLLMGPFTVEALQESLNAYSEQAAEKLSKDHYETYQAFQKAAEEARLDIYGHGFLGAILIH
jgi:hypothetical protein